MIKQNQNGSVVTTAVIIVLSLALVVTAALAFSAYSTGQDYKKNSDQKAAAAVDRATREQANKLEAKFAEEAKKPSKPFRGPEAYGGVSFEYPKTWSVYMTSDDSQPVNAYFHPDVVQGIDGKVAMALRLEIINSSYADVVRQFESDISSGKLRARAYVASKMENVPNAQPGLRLEGDLGDGQTVKNGAMVILPLRDKALKIYSESSNYLSDFNNTILPVLSYSP